MYKTANKFKYEWVYKSTSKALLNILPRILKKEGYKLDINKDYIYAWHSKGSIPVCLIAHVDTIHDVPDNIYFDHVANVIWSPEGLGGDDRAGVAALLEIISRGYKPHILFLDGEERGGIGAKKAAKLPCPKVNCLVELDRQGSFDAVFYNCGNKVFKEYIESFGFKTENGTYSDISDLCPEWDIAGVNLSIGYYNQHTRMEYVKLNEWEETIKKIIEILKNPPKSKFDYQPNLNIFSNYNNAFKNYDDYDDYFYNTYNRNKYFKYIPLNNITYKISKGGEKNEDN